MSETTDQLALAAEQLTVTSDRLVQLGVTPDDLAAVAEYLCVLTEHGHQVCGLANNAIGRTDPDHPVRRIPHGFDVQAAIGHAMDLFGVAIHFALEAQQALNAIAEGEAQ